MRGLLLAGAICAGSFFVDDQNLVSSNKGWTYHDCVQNCRDNLPAGTTLQNCIREKNCNQYPKPHRTYGDCLKQCELLAKQTGQTLQHCLARYVCSQYPPQ